MERLDIKSLCILYKNRKGKYDFGKKSEQGI
ncbi:MAG: hypothetical protein ACI82S_002990 [Patiriisocius sp.]|jgi:hypothetical protein